MIFREELQHSVKQTLFPFWNTGQHQNYASKDTIFLMCLPVQGKFGLKSVIKKIEKMSHGGKSRGPEKYQISVTYFLNCIQQGQPFEPNKNRFPSNFVISQSKKSLFSLSFQAKTKEPSNYNRVNLESKKLRVLSTICIYALFDLGHMKLCNVQKICTNYVIMNKDIYLK